MANLKSLKHFEKGYDPRRNTKGRPISKWARWKDAMEEELQKKVVTRGGSEVTTEVAIVMKLIENARKGDLSATKLYFDYRFGKPPTYCARCERRNKQALAILEKRKREEELRNSKEEKKRIAREMKEVDEWIEGWFPKEPKGKKK